MTSKANAEAVFMRRALALARRGWGQVSPNPLVGAVVVREGEIVGEGYHARYGGEHAEVAALRKAGKLAHGSTLYVSLEPCSHHGRTPPCTDAILAAGVRRVVAATLDPNPEAGGGLPLLAARGISVASGVEEAAARELNADFIHRFSTDIPWVILKLALSLDGAIADHTRKPGWLTNEGSRRAVHRMRAGVDAIAVGIGTAIADDPQLTVRSGPFPRQAPLRIVLDRSCRLPLDSALVRTARDVPVLVCTEQPESAAAQALAAAGVELMPTTDLPEAFRKLRQRGVNSILVEGGAGITGALLMREMVDRLVIFQAPVILGAGALGGFSSAPAVSAASARRLRVVTRRRIGDDLVTSYALGQYGSDS